MNNPRLAGRYAKSLLDLAQEQNALDTTLADVQLLSDSVKGSPELALLLRSPILKADKKNAVLKAVFGDKMGHITNAFMNLLVAKGREANLPEIATAFIDQYKALKNIRQVKLITAGPIDESVKESIRQKVAASMPDKTVEMTTSVNPDLIGGWVLEMDDRVVDASIRRDLMDIRKQFMDNQYVSKMVAS